MLGIGSPLPFISVRQGALLNYLRLFSAYKQRVTADSGLIAADVQTKKLFKLLEPTFDSIEFAWSGVAGSKLRTDGIYDYYTKMYDMFGTNDATQTTEVSQPYQSGKIAPNEFPALQNPNGDTRYVEHPDISFAANEAWTVTTVSKNDLSNNLFIERNTICGTLGGSYIGFQVDSNIFIRFYNGATTYAFSHDITQYIGKNTIYTFSYDGIGSLSLYINGLFIESISVVGVFSASAIMTSRVYDLGYAFKGTISSHTIRRQALTPEQILAEAQLLQTIYPEIPSVQIGTQTWATSNCDMVATPMGTVIDNVTLDATWATSQTLYDDYLIANPGDTYGATKAAAMWSFYNNDSQIGSWGGKLYNWFAVSLLQQDIDLYNAANPSTPWGYHVPSSTEFNTLATTLGGTSVAGGKMKKEGFDYWLSPNTGADNSSGFTFLPSGLRNDNGAFIVPENGYVISIDNNYLRCNASSAEALIAEQIGVFIKRGFPIRLIKD